MVRWHLKSKRTPTGKRASRVRKKRNIDKGSHFLETKIGKRKVRGKRAKGGGEKLKVLAVEKINVTDPRTKKIRRVKILSVKKNPSNPHYVRRDIVTKGAVVETEAGDVLITSRPGQDGVVNGKLLVEGK